MRHALTWANQQGDAAPAASPGWVSRWFAALCFTFYAGAITPPVHFFRGEPVLLAGNTDWLNMLCQVLVLTGLMFFLSRRWRDVLPLLRLLSPYLLVLALCGVSALWSSYPAVSLRRTGSLSICFAFGVYCYVMFGLPNTLRLLGNTTTCLALLSVVVYLAFPAVGHETAEGYSQAMRGIFSQKNGVGSAMVLGISCFLYPVSREGSSRLRRWLAVLLMLICIILSQSATALVITAAVMGVTMLRRFSIPVIVYIIGSFVLVFAFILTFLPELPFAMIGRDASLTGRGPLWQMSLRAAELRPWLGYGFYGFWNENSRVASYIWSAIGWRATSAHSGYIEVVLEIGIVGLALYLWIWIRMATMAIAASASSSPNPVAGWVLLYLVIVLLLNLDEGTMPQPDQYAALMPIITCALEAWRRHSQRLPDRGRHRTGRWHPTFG